MTATRTRTEFWVSSGHHMTRPSEGGGLLVTDELILAYLARPELVPPPEACAAERELHASLLAEPRRPVTPAMIAALADEDARENWRFMVGFRDKLLAARTIEAAYLAIVRDGARGVPPVFLNQLVHLILRNALDGCEDSFVLRAAELFFRPQKASLRDGTLLLADQELVEGLEEERRALMATSPLTAMLGKDAAENLDVMTDETAPSYWSRSDAFSMVMNIGGDPRARDGLARVVETFVGHLLAAAVAVEPIERIEDRDWRWFVGLDAEGSRLGNLLWKGESVDPTEAARVVALFRMTFADPARVDPKVAGFPVYLVLAADEAMVVRLKPQNLVVGLPLKTTKAA